MRYEAWRVAVVVVFALVLGGTVWRASEALGPRYDALGAGLASVAALYSAVYGERWTRPA